MATLEEIEDQIGVLSRHLFDINVGLTNELQQIKYLVQGLASAIDTVRDDWIDYKVPEKLEQVHRALQAETFGSDRVANLGYYIERIARVLGISVNPDGSIRSIRQKAVVKNGQSLPGGWSWGQWGLNEGGSSQGQKGGNAGEFRDGMAYEVRANQFERNIFTEALDKIQPGDYVLVENWPQLIDTMLDDLDKCLGLQDLGAGVVPNADDSGKYARFEGLAAYIQEALYSISATHQAATQGLVSSLLTQGMTRECLRAFGQPLTPTSTEVSLGNSTTQLPYPGISSDAVSQFQQTLLILQNLALVLGNSLKIEAGGTE